MPLLYQLLYLAVGALLYVGFGFWAYSRTRSDSADSYFLGASDLIGLLLWPIALPFLIIKTLKKTSRSKEKTAPAEHAPSLVGAYAITSSDLRPSGTVRIENTSYTALSNNGFIQSGVKVTVIQQDKIRLVVRKVSS